MPPPLGLMIALGTLPRAAPPIALTRSGRLTLGYIMTTPSGSLAGGPNGAKHPCHTNPHGPEGCQKPTTTPPCQQRPQRGDTPQGHATRRHINPNGPEGRQKPIAKPNPTAPTGPPHNSPGSGATGARQSPTGRRWATGVTQPWVTKSPQPQAPKAATHPSVPNFWYSSSLALSLNLMPLMYAPITGSDTRPHCLLHAYP
jgi:hypothetical protein